MTLFWLTVAVLYSLGATAFITVIQRRHTRDVSLASSFSKLLQENFSPLERIQALSELAKLRASEGAWYEKSISVVGVIAFFSMLVATGLQTVNSSITALQADQLRKELTTLEGERSKTDNLLATVSRSIMDQSRISGKIDRSGQEILRDRLSRLQSLPKPDKEELTELFDVSLLLGDFETAKECLDRNAELLDRARPENLLRLAEYEYIQGTPMAAKEYLKRLENDSTRLPIPWQVRIVIVRALVNGNVEQSAIELAAILRIDKAEAAQRLSVEMEKYMKAANREKGSRSSK
jgi:hypothetical protein